MALAQLVARLPLARRVDDADVVSARGQHEGLIRIGEGIELEHRSPGCDMVLDRADVEDRYADVREIDRLSRDLPFATRERVAKEHAAEVLEMHPVGQARAVGVPGHQVAHGLTFAKQVAVQPMRPDQVVGAKHLEGAGHLSLVEVAAPSHAGLEEGNLAFVDEEAQLSGLREVGLGGEQAERAQRRFTFLAQRRGDGGEQRAAEAVAGGMHLPARNDGWQSPAAPPGPRARNSRPCRGRGRSHPGSSRRSRTP